MQKILNKILTNSIQQYDIILISYHVKNDSSTYYQMGLSKECSVALTLENQSI